MRNLFLSLLCFVLGSSFTTHWEADFDKALQAAKVSHKCILLNFSGSDWCGPCIKLHKQYFDSDAFTKFAADKLIMVNADFPRQKKNQLSRPLQEQNDRLAEQYNRKGSFPETVLLSPEGRILKEWDGFPKMSLDDFIGDIQSAITAQ
ncbi:MAG TPA: thioredoxin family protein [Sediminibacterium sp.]|nr:thioredoxin family protein [Sediminibacterium sp.]